MKPNITSMSQYSHLLARISSRPIQIFGYAWILWLLGGASVLATAAPPAASAIADARQRRADLLREEIKTIDGRAENRVAVIIDGLTGIADSKDSRTKVARIKEDTIDALSKNIDYYRAKRDAIREQLRRPTLNLTPDQKTRILGTLNSRIEKRVAQILEIQKSLPSHKDYERYKVVGSSWAGPEYARNQDYDQNRRVTQYTSATQKKVLDGLSASVSSLRQQNQVLQQSLSTVSDSAQRQALAGEIARNDALINERQRQRLDVAKAPDTASRSIGMKEATDLDQALRKAVAELRSDFTALFARYNSYLQALADVNAVRPT
jgi:hypothetical protein